ncbi:MAG: family 78 glycoside hydrolase catalytic domain [Phycisphaeraceae bacterium]
MADAFHSDRPASILSPFDLLCNESVHALALGEGPVRLSWMLSAGGAGEAMASAVQSAYQVRLAASPESVDGGLLWDSGRVDSSSTHATLPEAVIGVLPDRFAWSVRVWDRADHASDWSESACAEVGLRSRAEFAGKWIGPSENLLASPLPEMGPWIVAGQAAVRDGESVFATTFDLLEGFPRCVGSCWLAADPACSVVLNGDKLDGQGCQLALDQPAAINLPWDKLKRGRNTLEITGPAGKLAQGISCMARIWQAEGGYVVVHSGDAWVLDGQAVSEIDRPRPKITNDNGPRRSVELTRTFNLDRVSNQARAYVTGLGIYELFINGTRVGDELFAPGWTDTDCRLHYAAHDVSALLKQGKNHITARLGNGWWSSGMGWEHKGIAAKPDQPLRLLMDLVDHDAEGNAKRLVVTDDAWQWRPSEILHDTIYHGQITDLHESTAAWQPVQILDDGLSPLIEPAIGEPIRVTDEISAVSVKRLASGDVLYDFGQNHSGRPRLRASLPEGTRIQIRHCEELDEHGQPYFENYRTAAVTDTLIASGGPIDWSPQFTYRGYRYALLIGLPSDIPADDAMLVSQLLHNDVAQVSSFDCSNSLLNDIDQLVRWGIRTNLHSVPTDCPQRDERLGWTGDVQLVAPTSCWMFDLHGFYTKWLQDLVDAQREDGGITHIAPFTPVLPNESAPVWGDVMTVLPEVLHRFYDDPQILERMYEPMKQWVGWYEARADDGLAEVGGFGDWVALEDTPPELCGTAYYAHSSRVLSHVAGLLGKQGDASRYAEQADRAAQAYHRKYFDSQAGHYQPNTQTAQLLSLHFDLAPEPLRQGIADHLAQLVKQCGDKPATGFVGTALLLPVLTRFGYHELAYRVLNTRAFPSLGYMIDQGATTVWERWNTDKEGPEMNSRNHFCLGAMAQWFYEELVGITPDAQVAGFRKVRLEPKPVGDLTHAKLRYISPQGPIEVHWQRQGDRLVYEVSLPANVQAELHLPSSSPNATEVACLHEGGAGAERKAGSDSHACYTLEPGQYRLTTPVVQLAAMPIA